MERLGCARGSAVCSEAVHVKPEQECLVFSLEWIVHVCSLLESGKLDQYLGLSGRVEHLTSGRDSRAYHCKKGYKVFYRRVVSLRDFQETLKLAKITDSSVHRKNLLLNLTTYPCTAHILSNMDGLVVGEFTIRVAIFKHVKRIVLIRDDREYSTSRLTGKQEMLWLEKPSDGFRFDLQLNTWRRDDFDHMYANKR